MKPITIEEPLTQSQVFDRLTKLRAATTQELKQCYFNYLDITDDTEHEIKAILAECHKLGLTVSYYRTSPNKVLKIANMAGTDSLQKSFVKLNEKEVSLFCETLFDAEMSFRLHDNKLKEYHAVIRNLKSKTKSKHLIKCCNIFLDFNLNQIEIRLECFKIQAEKNNGISNASRTI